MESNYRVLFYLKRPKGWDKGPIPIYMRITVDGIEKEVSAGRSCEPARWCSKSNRETGTKESVRLLNAYLDELEKKVEEAHLQLIKERKEVTTLSLKNKFLGKEEQKPMLLDIFNIHNKQMEELLGNEYEENTLKGYRTTISHLKGFIATQYKATDICIDKLDFSFITSFEHYLKTIGKLEPISAKKYIKNLKKVVSNYIDRVSFLA